MAGETDQSDKRETRRIAILFVALIGIIGLGIVLLLPYLADFIAVHFEPGVGLKTAAVIAFFVTVITLVIFAIAAGDGIIGEIQFMLASFFTFFIIIWLMVAWIF